MAKASKTKETKAKADKTKASKVKESKSSKAKETKAKAKKPKVAKTKERKAKAENIRPVDAKKKRAKKPATEKKRLPRSRGQVYSGIEELPLGFASENLTKGCLVLEGGAFRGLYTSGVLDALMENDINLQSTIGVSAGALYGFCYTGAQLGSARINLRYRHDNRYVGSRAIKKNHGIFGWDFLFGRIQLQTAEERRRFFDERRRFVAVVTNIDTGKAEYLEKGDVDHRPCYDIVAATCASASMPYISKPVWVGASRYLDGGCADKIPFQWAIDEGYEKIIVVRTRDRAFRRDTGKATERMAKATYGKEFPAFAEVFGKSDFAYNEQCDRLEELEREGRLLVIYPSEPVEVTRLEKDMEKLGALYHLGYDDTMAMMDKIKAYLAE
jgi:predicted patatin/cPLA2 family phospholipase